jgi:glyoxylase-like metal-dependent hydrolase (beta-lactamase superfamily II)
VLNPAHNLMEIRVTSVQPNAPVPAMPVPDAVRTAAAPSFAVQQTAKLADGVWLLTGSHNSIAVEFSDFVAVVEAPLNEARAIAVIDEVTKLVPNKPIKYLINTHHHFDHSGGLRTYLAQGTTIVTSEANRDFYQDVMFAPLSRTLLPDRLSTYYPNFTTSRRPAPIETVGQKYVVSDGTRVLELHPVQGSNHAAGMLMVYLPKEKLLVNADLYSPPAPNAQPVPPSAATLNFRQNIERLKLDVAQHVPIHGRVGTHAEFLKVTVAPPPAAPVQSRADRLQRERDNAELQRVPPFKAFDNLAYVGAGWVGAWLVPTDQGLILLDTLEERYVDHMLASISKLGYDPKDIKYVVVTQAHADHYGGAARIQQTYGAKVAMGEGDWAAVAEAAAAGQGPRAPKRDIVLKDGDTLKLGSTTLKFVSTPGHTPGTASVDFTVYDAGRPYRAFLVGGGAPAPGLRSAEQFVASLDKIERLQPGVQVRVVNHPWMDPAFWDRADALAGRTAGAGPHPMVAPQEYATWIQSLKESGNKALADARAKARSSN